MKTEYNDRRVAANRYRKVPGSTRPRLSEVVTRMHKCVINFKD